MKLLEQRFRRVSASALPAFVAALALAGCSSQAKLTPAPGAHEVAGRPYAAVSGVDRVQVLAEPNVWVGRADILQDVTPVRVTIRNRGRRPVRVRYTDLALVGPDGARYAAIPPYALKGTVEEPVWVQDYPPVAQPEFDEDGYEVAPYLGNMYPDLPPWHGRFYYDPFYYNHYYAYWATYHLPSREMVVEALPEGVVQPGGHVSGFVYFQRVSPKQPEVNFRLDLVNASSGNIFGEVRIPFSVKEA